MCCLFDPGIFDGAIFFEKKACEGFDDRAYLRIRKWRMEGNVKMSEWAERLNVVATHAWDAWTKNGLNLDDAGRVQTWKSVQDAANNAWQPRMTDIAWLSAALQRLE